MQAARALKKHGFEKLFNLSAGMAGWQQANLPVISGNKSRPAKEKDSSDKPVKKKRSKEHYISSSNSQDSTETGNVIDSNEEKIIVYFSGHCPFTAKVKKLLSEKGVEFQQVNLVGDPETRELIAAKSGQTTFPQVFRGETHIGNCDELYQLDQDGKLNDILGLKEARSVF